MQKFPSFFLILLLSLSFLSVLAVNISKVYAAEIFSSGWESGEVTDGGNWTVYDSGNPAVSPAVTNLTSHHGIYSLETNAVEFVYHDFTTINPLFVRWYWKTSTLPSNNEYYSVGALYNGSNVNGLGIWDLYIRQDGGDQRFKLVTPGDVYYEWNYTDGVDVLANTWYAIEIEYVKSATAGEFHMWFNGTEVITQTGLTTTWDGTEVHLGMPWADPNPPTSGIVFNDDCVVVSDGYIGPEPINSVSVVMPVTTSITDSEQTTFNLATNTQPTIEVSENLQSTFGLVLASDVISGISGLYNGVYNLLLTSSITSGISMLTQNIFNLALNSQTTTTITSNLQSIFNLVLSSGATTNIAVLVGTTIWIVDLGLGITTQVSTFAQGVYNVLLTSPVSTGIASYLQSVFNVILSGEISTGITGIYSMLTGATTWIVDLALSITPQVTALYNGAFNVLLSLLTANGITVLYGQIFNLVLSGQVTISTILTAVITQNITYIVDLILPITTALQASAFVYTATTGITYIVNLGLSITTALQAFINMVPLDLFNPVTLGVVISALAFAVTLAAFAIYERKRRRTK